MTPTQTSGAVWRMRFLRKDIGVALVVLIAWLFGGLLYRSVDTRTRVFDDRDAGFHIEYPAGWSEADSLQAVLLKVEDPEAASAYKSNLVVARRDLDPASPPTLQTLVDRRLEERRALAGFRFLDNRDATVAGAKSAELEYAYVAQPIDQPRRAALPVVVHVRELIVVAKDRSFYVTLSAPESEYDLANQRFAQMLRTVRIE